MTSQEETKSGVHLSSPPSSESSHVAMEIGMQGKEKKLEIPTSPNPITTFTLDALKKMEAANPTTWSKNLLPLNLAGLDNSYKQFLLTLNGGQNTGQAFSYLSFQLRRSNELMTARLCERLAFLPLLQAELLRYVLFETQNTDMVIGALEVASWHKKPVEDRLEQLVKGCGSYANYRTFAMNEYILPAPQFINDKYINQIASSYKKALLKKDIEVPYAVPLWPELSAKACLKRWGSLPWVAMVIPDQDSEEDVVCDKDFIHVVMNTIFPGCITELVALAAAHREVDYCTSGAKKNSEADEMLKGLLQHSHLAKPGTSKRKTGFFRWEQRKKTHKYKVQVVRSVNGSDVTLTLEGGDYDE